MSLTSDMLVDRRRLRRQLTFWRVASVLILILALIGAGFAFRKFSGPGGQAHIARMNIEGLITGRQETLDLLRDIEKSSASAVILRINSGGGTTSGSETLYTAVQTLSAKKPVIAVIDGVGASGAYMTALGAERIVANGSALVGSIGVIAQVPNVSKLLDTLGVKVRPCAPRRSRPCLQAWSRRRRKHAPRSKPRWPTATAGSVISWARAATSRARRWARSAMAASSRAGRLWA